MQKGYYISTDKDKLQIDRIKYLLSQSYWANTRSEETIVKSIENSLCYGVYDESDIQVGFGRIITDYSTTFYICDVIIDKEHRKRSLGKLLIKQMTEDPRFENLHGILATSDAHELYRKFGFEKNIISFMNKPRK